MSRLFLCMFCMLPGIVDEGKSASFNDHTLEFQLPETE
jgi:hypothetical protein